MSRLQSLKPKQVLAIVMLILVLIGGLSLASYKIPEKELTGRRGTLSFIPREYRELFVEYRAWAGGAAVALLVLTAAGWFGAESLSRAWQRTRNRELADNAVLLRLSPRVDDKSKWQAAADLWGALHSTLARPGWKTWLGGGMHISLEMAQQSGERIMFYLWCPRPVAQTLVRQLRATYAGLEIETLIKPDDQGAPTDEMDDYLARVRQEEDVRWAWADLGLAREPWRPLRTEFAGDTLASLLSTLEGVSPGNDLAAIHFVVRPAADGWQEGGKAFAAKLRGDNVKPGQPRPRLSSEDRALIRRIEEKGRSGGYDLCLRVVVAGSGDVEGNLDRLSRLFDQFGDDNALGVRAGGDDSELYRVQGRYLPAGWGKSVVSGMELGTMAHLPNQDVSGISINRARARIEKPSPVSFVGPAEKRVVLGRFVDVPSFGGGLVELLYPLQALRQVLKLSTNGGVSGSGNGSGVDTDLSVDQQVGIKLKDGRRHFHVIGPTGVGKSTMLLFMIHQYLKDFPEASVWLQEPHQDLTHKVIRRVPLWREKDVIWLDVMDPERVIGINPMEMAPGADIGAVVGDILGVMRKVMGANWDSAVQMQEILENSLNALLVGQSEPTMVHLLKFLTDADYRYDLTYNLGDPISAPYWESMEQRKEKELDQMFSVPRRRVNKFLTNSIVRRIVAQPVSTVNFRQALDSGKIILVQLDGRMGGENRTFVGAMMMYKLFSSVMSRMDIPEEQRRQVAICVDEFQTFVGQSGQEFADILEQARKMGASLTLAHQHLGQLSGGGGDLVNSVANNTGTKVVFRSEAADAPQFLKWLPELKTVEDLTTLANFRCYVRPMVNGSPQPVCTLYTYPDPPVPDPQEELRHERRGEPDPLPPHPGAEALGMVETVRALSTGEARKQYLKALSDDGWATYVAGRRYHDAVRRNQLIENPELIPDKLERIRALVRLGYGTPHYETEAQVEKILG